MFGKPSILPQVNVRLRNIIFFVATFFATGQVLLVLKNATTMVIALTRKYVWMINAKRVAEIIIIANQEQNAIKTHALLPAKWEIPANQLIIVILTIKFVFQNVIRIMIVKLITNVMEGNVFNLVLNPTNVLQPISIVTSKQNCL